MSFNINSTIQAHTAILTGITNYAHWSRQLHSLLTMAGWWSIVDGTSTHAGQADPATHTTWIANDQQAQAIITIFIHLDLQHYQKEAYVAAGNITHPSMARDLWTTLRQLYAPTGVTGQFDSFSKAIKYHIIDPREYRGHNMEDLPNQINHLINIFNEMSAAGLTLPDNLKAMILLNSLPHSYKSVISTIIQTTTAANFTMEHMIPLIIAESQLRHSTGSRSLVHHLFQEPTVEVNRTSTIQRAPCSTETCSHCQKNHPSDRCWQVYGCPGQCTNTNNRGGFTSNRGKKPFVPNRSGPPQGQNK